MEKDALPRALVLAHSLLNARIPNLRVRPVNLHNHTREKRKRGQVQRESKQSRGQSQRMTMGGRNTGIKSTPVGLKTQTVNLRLA
ncbi:hypothetical protein BDR07DRAFT_1409581 [Suillus spraguei]|nr:hypothetical protein BDR07DRAFT_1409581 [Suillus spraguei]